ncbi:MAG: M14 family metallopeptidase [Anaerolineales bacterium]
MITIPETYEAGRERFYASLATVQKAWPEARLHNHSLGSEPGLSIDWISAEAQTTPEKILLVTTGEHGIEGYVGSALLQLFIEEYLPRLDPHTTGLLLVHAINPWGMKHRRRVNANNVDLNRSFVRDFASLGSANPDYDILYNLLNPSRPLRAVPWQIAGFIVQAVTNLARYGMGRLREATLRGQFSHPEGIYFGGQSPQEETRLMMDLYEQAISAYGRMLTIDLHTGYGPLNQMILVASAQEKMTSTEMVAKFGIPNVAAANPEEFYSIQGDMIEYLYTLMKEKFPGKPFFAATCEFGTFGDSTLAVIRSLYTTVFENRLFQHGGSSSAKKWMAREYTELFAPTAPEWFEKAQADARQAFEGLLKAEGYLTGAG